ncbi:MAG: hypothetical protein K6F62_01265 [Schwartzia sp.]|nr:hypothetical protein [Schwartzia sp. (in: firmicutes)]
MAKHELMRYDSAKDVLRLVETLSEEVLPLAKHELMRYNKKTMGRCVYLPPAAKYRPK